MKLISKKALLEGMIITLIATVVGLCVNVFHPKRAFITSKRPALEYVADSLFAQDLPAVEILVDSNNQGEPFVNINQVRQLIIKDQALLLDARSESEYIDSHIPTAINLPLDFLTDYYEPINSLPEDKWLICYCDGPPCDLGELLAQELSLIGFKYVAIYQDGINDWKKIYKVIEGKEVGDFEN